MTEQGQTGQVPSVDQIQPAHGQACAGDASEDDGTNSSNGEALNVSAQSSPTSGLALLIEWANGQDHWVRKIVDEVIKTRSLLSDEHVTAIYELFLREKKLAQGDPPNVERLSSSRLSVTTAMALRLVSLEHIENVNALTPDQEMKFHERLTVCFGENGSGKTGYVRILKQAAGVRTAQPVLRNIRADGPGRTPRARIKIACGDALRTIDWHGQQGIEPLGSVVIFDAGAAVVHIADDLTYSYTPADLSLFPLVTDGIDRVQRKIQSAKEERELHKTPTENRFPQESQLYAIIKDLGASTKLPEIEALAEISDEEEASLSSLREKVTALSTGAVRQQITVKGQERDALAQVLSIGQTIADFDRDAYLEAIVALRSARVNHEQATREALAGENIPGILGKAWQEFVEAAEGYIKEVGLDPYPESDDSCIYCRQPLDSAAVGLIQKYRDYCNAALRQEVERTNERPRELCVAVSNLQLDDNERDLDRLLKAVSDPSSSQPALAAGLEVIQQGRVLFRVITDEGDCPPTADGVLLPLSIVRAGAEAAKIAWNDLCKEGEDRERVLGEERTRLQDLEERLTLRGLMPAIEGYVQAAEWANRCTLYLRPFQGIKRSLTDTAKRASTEVMNRHFQNLFREECQSLRAPSVTLEFPGREGQALRRKVLTPEYGLCEILSEGEQKVIALADFLAEATLNPDRSPIVLDDPVTSLDHKRMRHVVDRLVELSRNRQVVVFTHDIWFAAELLGRFEQEPKECAFYDVTVEDERIGLLEGGSHPRTDTFNDRRRHIADLIEQADKETGKKRQSLVEKGYEELRGACEIVVEKDLLKGVIERYRPNVRMTVLRQISADRLPDAIQKIVPIFEKCSRIISSHSQPLVTRGVRTPLDELKDDWKTLQDTRREYLRE